MSSAELTTCACSVCNQVGDPTDRRLSTKQNSVEILVMSEYTVKQFADITMTAASIFTPDKIMSTQSILIFFGIAWVGFPALSFMLKLLSRSSGEVDVHDRVADHNKNNEVILKFREYVYAMVPEVYDNNVRK